MSALGWHSVLTIIPPTLVVAREAKCLCELSLTGSEYSCYPSYPKGTLCLVMCDQYA
uniref:Uncharacterized protein n=1 Tax=Anguilla anguilla TaxID=7936 RepID=A0A0E9WCZ9_ANGAN